MKIDGYFGVLISGAKANTVAKRLGFDGIHLQHAEGFVEGIWILWKSNEVRLHILHSSRYVVTAFVMANNKSWIMSFVYATPNPTTHRTIWNLLYKIRDVIQLPWLIMEDFNEIVSSNEKHGGASGFTNIGFGEWIDNGNVTNLGFSGSRFTWIKNPLYSSSLRPRLDRALAIVN